MKKLKFTIEDIDDEDYKKYVGDYIVREWTWKERADIVEDASTTKTDAKGDIDMTINSKNLLYGQLRKLLVKAPFDITQEEIDNLPVEVGEIIIKHIQMVISLKKKLSVATTN